MTMGLTDKSAQYVINNLSESQLMSIIRILGEEKDAKKIAKNIAKARVEKEITRVDELVNIIEKSKKKNFSRFENFQISAWNKEIAVGLTGSFLCSK